MNKFKVGTNFDFEMLKKINELNKFSKKNKITELYGSVRLDAKYAARPDFRLPDISRFDLEQYVQKARKYDIKFNYTLNSINPCGSKQSLYDSAESFKNLIIYLYGIGVERVTVSNPVLLELIREINKNIEIEISTISHVDTISQIRYYHETYGVNKICNNLNKNRDFKWLKKAAKYCNENGIELELMVNEFCGVGGKDYSTHCIYRDSCYICHSTNRTTEDALLLNNYPMRLCSESRNENPANWLRVKFIRPEDIRYYNNIGIENFKITGRTGSSEYLEKVISAYLNESFDGNLIELWKPLESIAENKDEKFTVHNIPNKQLFGFIDKFTDEEHNCDYEVCGQTCRYCENFYLNIGGKK